jgi:phospholipid/cholesterol/gamma-HCH transport system substrate-binding protein
MIIKKSVQQFIKSDGLATIGAEGIIGDRVLILTQGSSEAQPVKDNEYMLSVEPVETDAIITSLSVTAGNFEIISDQLAEIMIKINHGHGTLGRLIQDTAIAENINRTIINLRKSTRGLDENMQAAKSNFLFKGYFHKKEREAAKFTQDSLAIMKDSLKSNQSDSSRPE